MQIPEALHKAVAEVSKIGNSRRSWLVANVQILMFIAHGRCNTSDDSVSICVARAALSTLDMETSRTAMMEPQGVQPTFQTWKKSCRIASLSALRVPFLEETLRLLILE